MSMSGAGLTNFALPLHRDLGAVTVGLTLHWSSVLGSGTDLGERSQSVTSVSRLNEVRVTVAPGSHHAKLVFTASALQA